MLVDKLEQNNTEQSGRVKAFGLLGMAVGLGFALGPLIGGLIGMLSPKATAITASLAMLISFMIALLKLDETHFSMDENTITKPVCSVEKVQILTQYRVVSHFIPFLIIGIAAGPYSIWFIFSQASFHWNSFQNGVFLFGHGCAQAITQGVFLSAISPYYVSEKAVLFLGLFSSTIVFFTYAVLNESSSWLIFGLFPIIMATYLTEPILRLVFSQLVPQSDQGTLQGALASLSTLSNALGPLIAASLFAQGSKYNDNDTIKKSLCYHIIGTSSSNKYCFNPLGIPFLLSSCLFLIAMVFMRHAYHVKRRTDPIIIGGKERNNTSKYNSNQQQHEENVFSQHDHSNHQNRNYNNKNSSFHYGNSNEENGEDASETSYLILPSAQAHHEDFTIEL